MEAEDIVSYLIKMIRPPEIYNPVILTPQDLSVVEWSKYQDRSVHGMIVFEDPSPFMTEIDRILRPGAHFLFVGEDSESFEWTCFVEDFGYEIRDAVAVLEDAGEGLYSPKTNPKERHMGVTAHRAKDGREVQNNHECVKPVRVMKQLLQDVPVGVVVDAFMGSGSTGIACLKTGHDFVGIEQDAKYLWIANERVSAWDSAHNAWARKVTIESEAKTPKIDLDPLGELGALLR